MSAGLRRIRLPLLAPHVAAHGVEAQREVVLVWAEDASGCRGWGECPTLARPGYSEEWTDGAWAALRDHLLPALLAERALPAAGPMATGAVRDAVLDLRLRAADASLDAPATGARAIAVPYGVALGLDGDVREVARAAERATEAGARLLVVKIQPGWSEAPVAAARHVAPASLAVATDANGSFDASDPAHLDELRALDDLGIAFVEQPVAPGDLEGSARVAAALTAPVALDEGVARERDLAAAISVEAGSILTVKPARLGGVAAATRAMDLARTAGWEVHVGGMLESGVGRAAARLLAARPEVALPSMVGPTELLFADDVVEPVRAHHGLVPVADGAGLAPPPDPARLRRLTVDRWEVTAP